MDTKELTDILKVEGINAKGYGTIPKIVMQDTRLTPNAKCIYAYFASYAGSGSQAFPSVQTIIKHLVMNKDTFYKHFLLLKQFGYIKTSQLKSEGKFFRTIYTLCTNPTPETIEIKQSSPCPKFSDTVIPDTESSDTVKPDTNRNNKSKETISKKKHPSINSNKMMDRMDKANSLKGLNRAYEEVIAQNIEYEALKEQNPHDELLDDIYNIMVDTVKSKAQKVRIGQEDKPHETVKSIFLKLNQGNIEYVVQQIRNYKGTIKNPKSFTLTCLYNSYLSSAVGTQTGE